MPNNTMRDSENQWFIELNTWQRVFHSVANLIVRGILPISLQAYLLYLAISFPEFLYLYIPSIAVVLYYQYVSLRPESFFPQNRDEKIVVKIADGHLFYGVPGRELRITHPVVQKTGLFGCVNLEFGPSYYLPIPKKVAYDQGLLKYLVDCELLLK
jgi:hypothetical protein